MFVISELISILKKIRGSQRPIVIVRKIIVAILSVSVRLYIHMCDLPWNWALQNERVAAYNEKIRLSRFPQLSALMIFVKIPFLGFYFLKFFLNIFLKKSKNHACNIFLKILKNLKNSESTFFIFKNFFKKFYNLL